MSRKLTEKVMSNIGVLVSRVGYHERWNIRCDTLGTVFKITREKGITYYHVYWWDNLMLSRTNIIPYTHGQLLMLKENLQSFFTKENKFNGK